MTGDAAKTRDKIRKLLRLAESANAHEAANAAARARELMDRHRIAAASLDDAPTHEIVDHPERPLWSFSRPPRWRIGLAAAVAETGGCGVYLRHGVALAKATVDAVLVGRACDVDDVRFLDALLATQIERLTRRSARGRGRSWSHAFRLGVTAEVSERLRVAHASRDTTTHESPPPRGAEAALARLAKIDTEVTRWIAEHLDLRRPRRRSVRANASGYASGRAAGRSIVIEQASALSGA